MTLVPPPFTHLRRLTDEGGLYEHARGTQPRREHAYCVDDAARALVVVCRASLYEPDLADLGEQYLAFVLAGQADDGQFSNRRGLDLRWTDAPSVEDCWGRALWGLGAAVAVPALSDRALTAFEHGAVHRSPWSRAMAFAALGAAEVLAVRPGHTLARSLLADAATLIGKPSPGAWPWPEPRLTYANAALPEVLLLAGSELGRADLVSDGLLLLDFLLVNQTCDGHLSVVPVGGRGPSESGPGYDQQPIEVAALSDACARAFDLTSDERWLAGLELCAGWFFGANDSGTSLYDAESGGGCDGLEIDGRNDNQGAESTLALISTLQQARRLLQRTP